MATITQENNRWLVSGDMTVSQVNDLLDASAQLAVEGEMEVDLAAVTDVDTSSISLLFEWLRLAHARKCKLSFSNLPANLTSLATLYGVLELIPTSH